MKTPNWNTWFYIPDVALWEGVALSLNKEPPDDYDPITGSDPFIGIEEYKRRLLISKRNHGKVPGLDLVTINAARPKLSKVPLQGFANWACSIGWKVPEPFAELGKQWTGQTETKAHAKWPWGDHETELLRTLADAAHHWWSTYDPEDKSTAPKSDEVSKWIKDQKKVADRVAEVMAQILRADGLPTGPR